MAKPQREADGAPEHRPLPSVDLALLPHELRASRARAAALGVTALLLVGVVLAVVFSQEWFSALTDVQPEQDDRPWPSERGEGGGVLAAGAAADEEPEATPAAEVASPGGETQPSEPGAEPALAAATDAQKQDAPTDDPFGMAELTPEEAGRTVKTFGKSRGFRDALRNAGASPEDADALVLALEDLIDFRRCRPEHELIFERDPAGRLVGFEYVAGLTERFEARRQPDGGFEGKRAEIPVETRRLSRAGHVRDSLGQALDALGLGRSLASVFVEAFEEKVDFKRDTREGDIFRIIVEDEYVDGEFLRHGTVHGLSYDGERTGKHMAVWFEPQGREGDFYSQDGRAIHGGWLRTPLRYDHISSRYNLRRRHPILKRIVPHRGVDYAAASGTLVWAAADGVVTFAGPKGANGNLIALRHPGGYETYYAHLLRISRGIKKGARVAQRQTIGAVGSTGRSTGPHLHFALKRNGRFIDPETQLNGPGKPLPSGQMGRFKAKVRRIKKELAAIPLAPAPAAGSAGADSETTEVFHEDEPLDL
ncbi:MAG: M23 family metallopeptidase [Myxococcales bacterium]